MILQQLEAKDLLALPKHKRDEFLQSYTRHQINTIFATRRPVDEDLLKAICEKVFWKTCLRLKPDHARILIRTYPEAATLITAPAGLTDHAVDHFTDVLCIFLTGVPWTNSEGYRDILYDQYQKIFEEVFNFRQRMERMERLRMNASKYPAQNGDQEEDVCPACSVHGNSHVCHNNYHLRFK